MSLRRFYKQIHLSWTCFIGSLTTRTLQGQDSGIRGFREPGWRNREEGFENQVLEPGDLDRELGVRNQVVWVFWGFGVCSRFCEPRYELLVGDTTCAYFLAVLAHDGDANNFSEAFLVQVLLLSEATHVCATPALWNLVDNKPDHFNHLRRESFDLFIYLLISS